MLRLHTLHVKDFAGIHEATLELQPNGVTVIYGPNEAGKSTMLKAFELLLSDTYVNSSSKHVKRFYPQDRDANPTVRADMTVGGYRLTIEKTYKSGGGNALLKIVEPNVETLTKRDAENRFQEILSAETDRTLVQALTIHQGESLNSFSARDVESLESVMSDREGDADGGTPVASFAANNAHSAALFELIKQEYGRYWTDSGRAKSKSDYQKKSVALEEARQELKRAETIYHEAQSFIDKLDQLEADKHRVLEQLPAARDAVEKREKDVRDAEAVAGQLKRLEDKLRNAQQEHAIATERWETRQRLLAELSEEREQLEKLAHTLAQAQQAYEEEVEKTSVREQRKAALEATLDRAQVLRDVVAAAQRRLDSATAWAEDKETLDKLHTLDARKRELEKQLAANAATASAMKDFREALANLDAATQLRDSKVTNVHVTGPEESSISDDTGESYVLGTDGVSLPVSSKRVLTMGDYTVAMTPAKDQADHEREVQRASRIVAQISEKLGIDDGDGEAAETKAVERQQCEAEVSELSIIINQKSAGRSVDSIRQGIEQHQTAFEQAHDEVVTSSSAVELDEQAAETNQEIAAAWSRVCTQSDAVAGVSSPQEAPKALLHVDSSETFAPYVREVQAVLEAAEKALRAENTGEKSSTEFAQSFFSAQAMHESAKKTVAKKEETLAAARESQSDDELKGSVDKAKTCVDDAQAELGVARDEHQGVDLDRARDSYEAATTRAKNLEERLHTIDKDRAANEAYLEGRSDAADRLAETTAAVRKAESDFNRVEAQAKAAKLLYDTVTGARAQLQARYEEPFKEALEKIARAVYGEGVSFQLDEDFSVQTRVLDGVDLAPEQLSGGALEQMLILARIAVATLVGGGEAAPIFIDDALGFSDARRIEAMNSVLGRLGHDNQVIVLTCDIERFDGIPGARQIPIDSLKTTA